MAVKDERASALARLRNQAREEGVNYQTCLQLFVQEEFLRRLSRSPFRDNLILKGGMFLYTLTEFESRPTQDIDFMLQKMSNDVINIRSVMEEICCVHTENDYIAIEVLELEQITLWRQYPGVKTKLLGRIGNVRVPFSIDIGIDDIIVPRPVLRRIPTRLEGFDSPEICTYSLESTIAEKFDAVVQRMETTSRMKDFYDIYYLASTFNFEGSILTDAIRKTMEHRNHEMESGILERIERFAEDPALLRMWGAFDPVKETGLSFTVVMEVFREFLFPIAEAILNEGTYASFWDCMQKKWR